MLRIHVAKNFDFVPNNTGMFILSEKTGGERAAMDVVRMGREGIKMDVLIEESSFFL